MGKHEAFFLQNGTRFRIFLIVPIRCSSVLVLFSPQSASDGPEVKKLNPASRDSCTELTQGTVPNRLNRQVRTRPTCRSSIRSEVRFQEGAKTSNSGLEATFRESAPRHMNLKGIIMARSTPNDRKKRQDHRDNRYQVDKRIQDATDRRPGVESEALIWRKSGL